MHTYVPDITRVSKISSTCIYLYFHFFKHVSTFIIPCMYLYLMDSDLLGSFCMGSNAILHPIKLIVAKLYHYRNRPGGCITVHQRLILKIFIYCLAVIIIVYGACNFCTHALLSA